MTNARHFLNHIVGRGIRLKAVRPADVEEYLSIQRRRYRWRNGHQPADEAEWRSRYTAGVHTLLRLAQGSWPPPTSLESRVQAFKATLQQEQLRPDTIKQYLEQARLFLAYLDRQQVALERATPQDLDAGASGMSLPMRIWTAVSGTVFTNSRNFFSPYSRSLNTAMRSRAV
jgi:hypothetical protein